MSFNSYKQYGERSRSRANQVPKGACGYSRTEKKILLLQLTQRSEKSIVSYSTASEEQLRENKFGVFPVSQEAASRKDSVNLTVA